MSATVLLSRNSSFEALQDPFHLGSMPSGQHLTCRAAASCAVMRAPPAPSAANPFLGNAGQPSERARAGSAAQPFKPPSPLPAPLATLPLLPAPLPSVPTAAAADAQPSGVEALADQLEDLLVFTAASHHGPEDPQLLVHSPRVAAVAAASGDAAEGSDAASTPRASLVAAAAAAQAAQLSPMSQLVGEGSLAELLLPRGPRPLRDIARDLARSASHELAPVLALLDDLVPAAPPVPSPTPRPATVAPAAAAAAGASPMVPPAAARLCLLPPLAAAAAGVAAAAAVLDHPLSPTKLSPRSAASGPLSPSKSGMIQLVDLHKGEWHRAQSCSTTTTTSSECTTSSGDTQEGSIESTYPSCSPAPAAATAAYGCAPSQGHAPMQLEEPEGAAGDEEATSAFALPVDSIMTPEGICRVAAAGRRASLPRPASALALPSLDGLPDPLGGDDPSMEVTVHPATCIPVPLAALPDFAALTHSVGPLLAPAGTAAATAGGSLLGPGLSSESPFAAAATSLPGVNADLSPALAAGLPPSSAFARFLELLRSSSREFEAEGRVLRLRRYLRPDIPPQVLDAVLQALAANTRVEALYIQNFENGMGDTQLDRLVAVLRQGRIWALNVGENFNITRQAWERFSESLASTAVGYLFVSEAHLQGTDLKTRMRDAIRVNRRLAPPRDPQVVVHVGNMWWNPRLPDALPLAAGDNSSRGSGLASYQASRKRSSGKLEDALDAAVVSSSPLLRRPAGHRGFRVGFRGSLVPGASRATLLRPRPTPPRDPLLLLGPPGSSTPHHHLVGGSGALAGGPGTMLTRSRAGVIVGGSSANVMAMEAGVDDDDEDFHVEDEPSVSDEEIEDDGDLPPRFHRRSGHHSAAPARTSRRLLERVYPGSAPAGLPDQYASLPAAPISPSRSPAPAPKRQRGETSRDSSSGGGALLAGHDMEASSQAVAAQAAAPRRAAGSARGARNNGGRRSGGAQRAQRTQRAELKGKPSFAELVESGFMRPGQYTFTVGTAEVAATIEDDGAIRYGASRFRAISKFALVVLRERNPSRQSCDGWKEVAWNGEKLDVLRLRLQQYVRQQARRLGVHTAT